MVAPMLPELALAPLRRVDEAGLLHEVTLETQSSVRGPGAKYVITWTAEPAQPGRLSPASAGGQNIRADQPSPAGDWELALQSGATVVAGQRAMVRGETAGLAWQRLVLVTKVLHPRPHELRRRCLAIDVEITP